ncbi:MAG TPA: hypothetical protein VF544_19840 [Pyrinomonadaceae bacterium]|jgi:hypothetical protein
MSTQLPPDVNVSSAAQPPTAQQPRNGPPPPVAQPPINRMAGDLTRFSWRAYLITVLVLEIISFGILSLFGLLDIGIASILVIFGGVLIFASVVHVSAYFLNKIYSKLTEKKSIQRDINALQEQLSEDFFTNLVRINFKYIDKYYLQTQVQANRSFMLASVAASVSLLIIVIGILMMYMGSSDKMTPAYITTISGLLGEFIATVFFYLYNRTVSEMSHYHQKLVLTQNVSLALKIAQELTDTDSKSKAQVGLIECLSRDINMYLTMNLSKIKSEPAPAGKNGAPAGS